MPTVVTSSIALFSSRCPFLCFVIQVNNESLTSSLHSEIYLHSPFNALHHPEKYGQPQDQDSDPEGIPLHPISPVPPPLGYRLRAGLVKGLLQDDETVVPYRELFESPILGPKRATSAYPWIDGS